MMRFYDDRPVVCFSSERAAFGWERGALAAIHRFGFLVNGVGKGRDRRLSELLGARACVWAFRLSLCRKRGASSAVVEAIKRACRCGDDGGGCGVGAASALALTLILLPGLAYLLGYSQLLGSCLDGNGRNAAYSLGCTSHSNNRTRRRRKKDDDDDDESI